MPNNSKCCLGAIHREVNCSFFSVYKQKIKENNHFENKTLYSLKPEFRDCFTFETADLQKKIEDYNKKLTVTLKSSSFYNQYSFKNKPFSADVNKRLFSELALSPPLIETDVTP